MLDAPWVEDGRFTRVVAPAAEHPLAQPDAGRRSAQWPQVLTTRGTLGHRALALRDRHDRAAVRQPVEGPAVLRRPRLPPRRHGDALHDPGRRLARRGARRHARERPMAAVSPRACIRRSAWSSPRARSMSSAATRSPACTTSTATARPTSTNASATPTRPRPPATISSADSSATRRAASTPPRASRASCGSRADGRSVEVDGDRLPQPRRPGTRP